jgi:hypothetical protein
MTPSGSSAGYWTLPAPMVVVARPRQWGRSRPSRRPASAAPALVRARRGPRGVGARPPRAPAGHPAHPARLPRIPAGTSTIPTHRHSSTGLTDTAPTPELITLSSRPRPFTSHTLAPTGAHHLLASRKCQGVVAFDRASAGQTERASPTAQVRNLSEATKQSVAAKG